MDHETAVQLQAAERYLLDQFSPEERREFEEHFFCCPECASEVRAGSILAANLKAVLREEGTGTAKAKLSTFRRGHMFWPLVASAALNVLVLGGAAVQYLGIRNRQPEPLQPQFYRSFGIPAASRGDVAAFTVPKGAGFFGARFDIMPDQHFENFAYQILDGSGAILAQRAVQAPADAVSQRELAVPVHSLEAGTYQLVLFGKEHSKSVEISRVRFVIQ